MASDKIDAFDILHKAVEQKDPVGFEEGLSGCFPMQHGEGLCELLAEVLVADWHFRHEDVALAIQDLKCACAVEALERLPKSDNLVVRGFAQKRIDNWHPETSRKGNRFS